MRVGVGPAFWAIGSSQVLVQASRGAMGNFTVADLLVLDSLSQWRRQLGGNGELRQQRK